MYNNVQNVDHCHNQNELPFPPPYDLVAATKGLTYGVMETNTPIQITIPTYTLVLFMKFITI